MFPAALWWRPFVRVVSTWSVEPKSLQIPSLLHTGQVTLNKSLNISSPQFPQLWSRDNSIHPQRVALPWGWIKLAWAEALRMLCQNFHPCVQAFTIWLLQVMHWPMVYLQFYKLGVYSKLFQTGIQTVQWQIFLCFRKRNRVFSNCFFCLYIRVQGFSFHTEP